MIASFDIQRFRPDNIYMGKPIKNKIMTGGMFSRIIYSSDSISMNGVYITFDLSGQICEIFPSKFKIQFAPLPNSTSGQSKLYNTSLETTKNIIKSLCEIEHSILANISMPGKTPLYKLRDQLIQNNFKFFWMNDNITNLSTTSNPAKPKDTAGNFQNARFILKISGCWTTPTSYGITYKFSRVIC